MITAIIFIVIAYLCGSLSSAILVCKLLSLPDPRSEGSKNPGTTNVLRIAGKLPAILVLLGDILKGIIPVLLAHVFNINGFTLGLVALAAVVGHVFPIFFKFQGGKGVATFLGSVFALTPAVGIACAITWVVVAAIFRYSSLAALVAAALSLLYTIILGNFAYLIPILAMVALIGWKHRTNIQHLRTKTEPKIKLS